MPDLQRGRSVRSKRTVRNPVLGPDPGGTIPIPPASPSRFPPRPRQQSLLVATIAPELLLAKAATGRLEPNDADRARTLLRGTDTRNRKSVHKCRWSRRL